jgi:hypothetical protein
MNAHGLVGEETTLQCSPLGLQVIDSFFNSAPVAIFEVFIDRFDGTRWRVTTLKPMRTPSGIITLPGLGRRPVVLPGDPPEHYRLRVESESYIPSYRRQHDGYEFLVPPYNDTNPPAIPNANIGLLSLDPSAAYPYPADVRVLRGTVTEANGTPIRDATAIYAVGQVEAMTDENGHFALGLRRAPLAGQIAIDVHHDRTGRVRTMNLALPAALQSNQVIVLN